MYLHTAQTLFYSPEQPRIRRFTPFDRAVLEQREVFGGVQQNRPQVFGVEIDNPVVQTEELVRGSNRVAG